MNAVLSAVFIGVGATLIMDTWGAIRKRLLGIPAADYALVGRWVGHMAHGKFRHERIAAASPVPAERVIGWTVHYAIGVAFSAGMIWIAGADWLRQPAIAPALAFGIATVAAPFLLMQPGMGAGIAASRTPKPWSARLQSFLTHAIFGVGLWLAGWLHALVR